MAESTLMTVNVEMNSFMKQNEEFGIILQAMRGRQSSGLGSEFTNTLDELGKIGVKVAQEFVKQNRTIRTGDLLKNIDYTVEGKSLKLYTKGITYGGYIEFGFNHWRGKRFVGPWPFLRPTLNYISLLSQDRLASVMKNILTNGFRANATQGGYHPIIQTNRNIKSRSSSTIKREVRSIRSFYYSTSRYKGFGSPSYTSKNTTWGNYSGSPKQHRNLL